MGRANAEAKPDNERKQVRELELENESMKKQLVESNTKTAEAKSQAEQLLAVMAGNYKKAYTLEMRPFGTYRHMLMTPVGTC